MNKSIRPIAVDEDCQDTDVVLELQLERFNDLARASLVNWDVGPECELSLIKHRENAVYQLSTSGGINFALRVHRIGYHNNDALRSELQWMTALSNAGIHTPGNIKTVAGDWFVEQVCEHSGKTYQIDLLSWVDGTPLGSVEEGLEGDTAMLVSNFRQVGTLAARLHNETEKWQSPDGFYRQSWDVDGCFSGNAIWGRFQDLDVLTDEQLTTLHAAKEALLGLLMRLGKGADVYGLIHCDLVPENLLRSDHDLYLIDFDDSGYGWHLFELATSLFFLLGQPYFDEVYRALIEGYRSERELSDEQLELLPAFFLLRSLVYLGWAHTRKETATAKEMTPMIVDAALELAEAFLDESNTHN